MSSARKPLPGYQHRLLAAAPAMAALPGLSHVMVQHDDGCAIFRRHPCDCVPDISVLPATGGSVLLVDAHGEVSRTGRQ
jgi:hypothetical protein